MNNLQEKRYFSLLFFMKGNEKRVRNRVIETPYPRSSSLFEGGRSGFNIDFFVHSERNKA
jgi:hypothetical protein